MSGGLLLAYMAMRAGRVALVAPVLSSEGAMAALIAILVGESIAPRVGVTLVVIVLGIALAAIPGGSGGESVHHRHGHSIVFALGGALAFGASLYAAGRAGSALPAAWVAAAARLVGVPVLVVPLALSGRLQLTRAAVPLVLVSGSHRGPRLLLLHRRGPARNRHRRGDLLAIRRAGSARGLPDLR